MVSLFNLCFYIQRLGPFLGVPNFHFHFFLFFRQINIFSEWDGGGGYNVFGSLKIGPFLEGWGNFYAFYGQGTEWDFFFGGGGEMLKF